MGYNNEQMIERKHAVHNSLQNLLRNVKNDTHKFFLMHSRNWFQDSAFMQKANEELSDARKQKNPGDRISRQDTTSLLGRKRYLESE